VPNMVKCISVFGSCGLLIEGKGLVVMALRIRNGIMINTKLIVILATA
jgi:hypothetical protein